jgi:heme-degrading monooxygenase HmoA
MYLTREELQVAIGKSAAFENATENYFSLLRTQPGFLRATLLNSLGVPLRYTRLVQWESRGLANAFERGAAMARHVRGSDDQQITSATRPLEAYDNVHRIIGSGRVDACYLIDEIVTRGPTTLGDFEESRGAVYELRRQFGPGFGASLLSRFLGGANRYLIFGGFEREGDDQRTAQTEQIVAYWREHPTASTLVISAIRDPQAIIISSSDQAI